LLGVFAGGLGRGLEMHHDVRLDAPMVSRQDQKQAGILRGASNLFLLHRANSLLVF
jgi:hypothetical protein